MMKGIQSRMLCVTLCNNNTSYLYERKKYNKKVKGNCLGLVFVDGRINSL